MEFFTCAPTGRTLTSDWSANSFIMVVYVDIFSRVLDRNFKQNSHRQLFSDQSEVGIPEDSNLTKFDCC